MSLREVEMQIYDAMHNTIGAGIGWGIAKLVQGLRV